MKSSSLSDMERVVDVENKRGLELVACDDEKLEVNGNGVMATTAIATANADFMIHFLRYPISSSKTKTYSKNGVSLLTEDVACNLNREVGVGESDSELPKPCAFMERSTIIL